MSEPLKILIDRLKGGQTQKIEEGLNPAFLGPEEPELKFKEKVEVKGEAYVTDDHLIIHLKARTVVAMPCAVCNEMINTELKVDNFYFTKVIEEIPSAIFDYGEALREALLIELPIKVECNRGNCPERSTMTPYMRPETRTYFPFADLDDLK